MAGSLAPVMFWAVRTTLCRALRSEAEQLPYQAVMQPDYLQDTLDGAAVEPFEDLRTHAKSFQSPEGNRFCRAHFTTVMVCLDHVSLLVMWKLSTCSTAAPSMRMAACSVLFCL